MSHVHSELIKQWADGAEIEVKDITGWKPTKIPQWNANVLYRIRPRYAVVGLWPTTAEDQHPVITWALDPKATQFQVLYKQNPVAVFNSLETALKTAMLLNESNV